MECGKLLKEAFKGIDFRYKLNDTLSAIPDKQKLSKSQLKGYLLKKGVSPKEIKQSGLFDVPDVEALPMNIWKKELDMYGKHKITTVDGGQQYSDISLATMGKDTPTYKETLSTINKPKKYPPQMPHYSSEVETMNIPDTNIGGF